MEHYFHLLKPPYQPDNSFRSLKVEWLTLHEVLICAFSSNKSITSTILVWISISTISILTISITAISIIAVTIVLALILSLESIGDTGLLIRSQQFFYTSVNEFFDYFRGHTRASDSHCSTSQDISHDEIRYEI
ncbi:hypothetical protein Tco_1331076 [Tanacetum coccineum]